MYKELCSRNLSIPSNIQQSLFCLGQICTAKRFHSKKKKVYKRERKEKDGQKEEAPSFPFICNYSKVINEQIMAIFDYQEMHKKLCCNS